ncbi:VanZ family protein [Anabaena sphaerica FACHB-251]|uniref:VanZ family protein n=1 Tax=Anabaena sphaerica FACHB-251 TaxID=2692883 RepID=A0A927A2K5_9NOST|nr:VanZ family protein [Anabaena sphaerica]MBD2295356.1 VanZ family protein [Anabaena sphaerica FACHB-251]
MNQRKNPTQKPKVIKSYRLRLNLLFVLATTLVIVIATLYPFNFSLPHSFSVTDFFASFNHVSSFQDQVNNVLLFMPLGFYCANFLQKLKIRILLQIIIVLVLSAGLSLTVETLQIFLPSRSPTPADIVNNTLGGGLGLLGFYFWNYQKLSNTGSQTTGNSSRLSNQQITGFILAYVSFTLLISIFWQSTINLSNWDLNYPLVLGNERTGNRPWQGYISEVYITDKAISSYEARKGLNDATNYFKNLDGSLLANYQLNGKCCYQEQTGNLPELLWQGTPTNIEEEGQGVFVNSSQWLKTAESVKNLNQRISQKSEFTLFANLATENTQQTGPARIISISGSYLRRNLTLSQQGNYLDLRLRTPLTGENGADLQLMIPKVFTDNKFHQIIITYSRGTVQVYIDKVQRSYSFHLLELIPFNQKLFYYALIFIPLGASLAILNLLANNRVIVSKVLIPSGILLPSILMEAILITESHKSLSWKNLFLGILFTAGTMLIFKIRAEYLKARS